MQTKSEDPVSLNAYHNKEDNEDDRRRRNYRTNTPTYDNNQSERMDHTSVILELPSSPRLTKLIIPKSPTSST